MHKELHDFCQHSTVQQLHILQLIYVLNVDAPLIGINEQSIYDEVIGQQ